MSSLVLCLAAFAPRAASANPAIHLQLTQDALVGDLGGTAFGQSFGDAYRALRGLRLDNFDLGLLLSPSHKLMARVELGVTDDRHDRGYLLGAVELGYRWAPRWSRALQPFLSAGVGWVGGGIVCAAPADSGPVGACWDHNGDPQVHLQAGLDISLPAGWSGELRLPYRYLAELDRSLAAVTFGLRHSM